MIGVHTPEFAFERNVANVKKAVRSLGLATRLHRQRLRGLARVRKRLLAGAVFHRRAGARTGITISARANSNQSERVIQQLLAEAGKPDVSAGLVTVNASGAEAAADPKDAQSPETYIGYNRAEHFRFIGGKVQDAPHVYVAGTPRLNEWGLSGEWTIGGEHADLDARDGGIVYQFHARDLHLVLGPAPDGKAVPFRVTIDGEPPGDSHGADDDAEGRGVVTEQRLYQLVRQTGPITDHTFEIRFLDPGVQAYA